MTTLFVFAHPDDESFGPAGTIARVAKEDKAVVISLCSGNTPTRPHVAKERRANFNKVCNELGAVPGIFGSSDLHLDYHSAMHDISEVIRETHPHTIYTHNTGDVHKDHRLVAEVVLAAARPTLESTVKRLYMCEIPPSTIWSFGQFGTEFIPNSYIKLTPAEMELKRWAVSQYDTEVRTAPDPRSAAGMEALAKYRGSQVSSDWAEAFKLVYSID